MTLRRKAGLSLAILMSLGIAGYFVLHEYVRAAAFVVQAADIEGIAATAADLQTDAVVERDLRIPSRSGDMPGRWYSSGASSHPPILLIPGVHADGIDEPRLVGVARDLASLGHPVLTTELPDLKKYRVTPRATDMIEDAAAWLAAQLELAPASRIGIIGISFAGGLSIVAAARPSVAGRVAFVTSFGGHGDFARTLRYLCTGIQPDGTYRAPHDYGVAIILMGVAEEVVPADQVQPLRDAIVAFLEASHADMVDKARGREAFARARAMTNELAEPARTYMQYVNDRDVKRLGAVLLPYVSEFGEDPALSPSQSPPPSAPVYLLHGSDDNVIPAVESELLAADLRTRGAVVRLLTTPLITHAEVDRPPSLGEVWSLVRFWGNMLDE